MSETVWNEAIEAAARRVETIAGPRAAAGVRGLLRPPQPTFWEIFKRIGEAARVEIERMDAEAMAAGRPTWQQMQLLRNLADETMRRDLRLIRDQNDRLRLSYTLGGSPCLSHPIPDPGTTVMVANGWIEAMIGERAWEIAPAGRALVRDPPTPGDNQDMRLAAAYLGEGKPLREDPTRFEG